MLGWILFCGAILFVLRTVQLNIQARNRGFRGPLILPFLGAALSLMWVIKRSKSPLHGRRTFLEQLFEKYGDTSYVPLLSNKILMTRDPDVIQHILSKDRKFSNYKRWVPTVGTQSTDFAWQNTKWLFGEGIFMTDGETWAIQRELASPLFNKSSLDGMHTVFLNKAESVCKKLDGYMKEKKSFDVQQIYMQYTLDSFGIIGFNTDFDSLNHDIGFPSHFDRSQLILSQFFWDPSTRSGQPVKDYRESVEFLNDFIYKTIKSHDRNSGSPDLMTKFMNMRDADGNFYPDRWIRDIIFSFTIAGRDTTALLLTWTTYCLCQHPDVEAKLFREIEEQFPGDTPVTAEGIKNLKYLRNVLTETLRLYPSVPQTPRTAEEDDVLPNGMKVAAGTNIIYMQYFLHRNPKYWTDAESYIPERWDNHKTQHPFEYLPFHAGPMQCLGRHMALNEAKLLLCILLKRYKFKIVPNPDLILTLGIVSTLSPGLKVTVEPRSAQ